MIRLPVVNGIQGLRNASATFDGTNDYMLRGATLTGIADSKVGTIVARLKFNGGDGSVQRIFSSTGAAIELRRSAGGGFTLLAKNAAAASIMSDTTSSAYSLGEWINVLFSWDMTGSAPQMYIGDTDDAGTPAVFTNDSIDYTVANYSVGAFVNGTDKASIDISFLWFDATSAIDFSVEANRRKFFDANGNPVYLGSKGELPTGSSPSVYLKNHPSQFQINRGTGGNFTVTGTLT